MAVTAGEVIMEFGMKRVLASVQAAATLNKLYDGSPVSLTAISKESKLSTSYLEQIFKKLRAGINTKDLLGHKTQQQTDRYHDDRGKGWTTVAL